MSEAAPAPDRVKIRALVDLCQTAEHKGQDYANYMGRALTSQDNCDPTFREFFGDFYSETHEFVVKMDDYIAEFRAGTSNPTSLYESFRLSHMVKGAAATMGYMTISALSGALEALFQGARDGKVTITPARIDLVVATMALIGEELEGLKREMA